MIPEEAPQAYVCTKSVCEYMDDAHTDRVLLLPPRAEMGLDAQKKRVVYFWLFLYHVTVSVVTRGSERRVGSVWDQSFSSLKKMYTNKILMYCIVRLFGSTLDSQLI